MSDKNRINSIQETSIQITKTLLPPTPSSGSSSPMSTSSYSSSGAALTPTSSTQASSLTRLTTSLNTSTSSSISSSSSSSSSTNNLNNNSSPNSTLAYQRHDQHHLSHHGHRYLHNINSTNLNQELSLKNTSSSASTFLNSSLSSNLSPIQSNVSLNSSPSTTPTNSVGLNQLTLAANKPTKYNSSSSLLTLSTATITNTSNNTEPCIGHGHFFSKKTFHKPTYCHHCTEMLWGLIGQGFICEVCNFVCHEKCQKSVVTPCSSIAHSLIKNPVAHCWSESTHFKRKFCSICRKRLEDNLSVRCEICEYFVHVDCQVLAVNDCCETATYVPNRNLKSVASRHHWREGNLPSNSKCAVCKKTCWTSECLAGMRCEWCGITAHGICRQRIIDECNFGNLRDIIIPPFAVSVPRIEMNKETIFGLQNNRPKVRSNSSEWSSSGGDLKFEAVSDSATLTPPVSQTGFTNIGSNNHNSTSQSLLTQSYPLAANTNSSPSNSLPASPFFNSQTKDYNSNVQSKKKDKYKQNDDESEDSRETVRVYDGYSSYRKKVFRTVTVQKSCSYQTLLEVSLRTFHLNDDPNKYYISIPFIASSSRIMDDLQINEKIVVESNPIKTIKSATLNNNFEGTKPSILLRYKDQNTENIRIYPGVIKDVSGYQNIKINLETTVADTLKIALEKFEINTDEFEKYFLVQVLIDQDVVEKTLSMEEHPLKIVQQIRKESLCNNRMVRFYLQQKEDPHGPSVALFVGNLPNGLSQIQYEKILMDTLRNNIDLRWSKFDVIYYEYGSMVILYDDSAKAVRAFKMLKDSFYENKQLMVLLLPTIQPPMIPANVCPLLVFVNVKSGGQQGSELVTSFRHLLNPHQVFDLQNGGPLPGLYVFRNIESYRILACGGDGTIGWVLSCLDNVSQDAKCQSPPMAIVPLGTGNDLARVLRWGAGYTGAEEPINLLRDVIEAEEITLDRWTVVFHSDENKELDDLKRQLSIAVNVSQANTNEDNTEIYVMNNYFGIGIDADVCLDFHTAREENPNKFNSRLHNKKYYLQLGIRKMMNRGSCKDFNRHVTLEVDGRRVDLPQIEGIIILNILSWGSGANPWGPEKDDQFQKPTHYDGMLEVVGIKGVVHMGQIQSGLSSAIRLAQGGRIKIKMNTEIPVQVDGEPWLQAPCAITILKSALKATMLKKTKMKIKRRNTEPSVNLMNINQSGAKKAETEPVDPDGESEPF